MQTPEMRVLRKIKGVTIFGKVHTILIRESLYIELLLLQIERSLLRWFGHVSRMPQERLLNQTLYAKAKERG